MVRLEQAETRLRHADRLIGAGRLAALTAHEVGTPLNVVRMGLQALQRDEDDLAESLGELIGQIDLVTGRLRGMLDYSRAPRPRIQIVSLLQTAAAAVTLVGPLVRRHGAEVTFAGEDVYVRADAEQVHQVVFNLITNSLDAGAKRITIEGASDPVYGTLRVSDDGPGVAPSARHRVFDAFYTTKEAGQGTGLGLAVCVQIAAEHGGWIELESSDIGAVFVFWLRRG